MQKVQRPRQLDFTKPAVKVPQLEEFGTTEIEIPTSAPIIKPDKKVANIPEEKAQDKETNGHPIKKRKSSSGYIRLSINEQLPQIDKYDLTERDKEFFPKLPSPPWSYELLENAIEVAENLSTREILVNFENFEGPCKEALGFGDSISEVYAHIKSTRETLKRPLIRYLWKPSADDPNPYVAFRPRDKEKMKLRRNRENDREALNKMRILKNELEAARNLLEGIRIREVIKLRQVEYSINPKSQSPEENQRLLNDIKNYLSKSSKLPHKDIASSEKLNLQLKLRGSVSVKIPVKETQTFIPQLQDDNKEYDISAFLSTLLLEGIPRNLVPSIVGNPNLLNETIHPNLANKPQREVPIQIPKLHKILPSQHAIRAPNLLPFKIRRREGRGGRIYLDRYLEDSIDLPMLYCDKKDYSKEENLILEQKFHDIKEIYCYSDSDDDTESNKNVKSIIASFKGAWKQRRVLSH